MTSVKHARVSLLTVGAFCCCACGSAAPEQGEGKRAADTSIASAPVEPRCAPSREHFTDLGSLDPVQDVSVGMALNDRGTVVGYSYAPISPSEPTVHVFRWTPDTGMMDLGGGIFPTGVNDQDEIVGNSAKSGGLMQAVLWDAENGFHELGTLGGWDSYVRSINNRGQVVGEARDATQKRRPFIWEAKTGMVALEMPETDTVELNDINDFGIVVGSWSRSGNAAVPFKWTKEDGAVELDRLGSWGGSAFSINNNGEIVGFVMIDNVPVGVKWTACGAVRVPPPACVVDALPRAINDQGVMVGDNSFHPWQLPPYSTTYSAVRWDPTLEASVIPLQASSSTAEKVNNCGDVKGSRFMENKPHAYLWHPERAAQ